MDSGPLRGVELTGMFKKELRIEPIVIDLPIESVWDVLADVEKYGEWNSYSPEARTDFEVGSPIHLLLDMGPAKMKRISLTVDAYDPPRVFSWGTVFGVSWIFRGVREQHLEPVSESSCRYYCRERMTGLLVPLILAIFGNHMRRSYAKVGRELKRYAEAKHAGAP